MLKTTYCRTAWPRQIWGGEICGGLCGDIFEPARQGCPVVKKLRRVFLPPTTTVQWDPSIITLFFLPFQNLFLTEIRFHGKFVCVHLSPQILPVKLFAANFASKMFRRRQFFAGAVFRRHRFSPAAVFAALTLHAALKNINSALLPPLKKRQAKQPQATCMCPVVTGEKSHFYFLIMTITIVIACQPAIPASKFCSLNVSPVFRSAGRLP